VTWPRLWILGFVSFATGCVPNEAADGKQAYAISTPSIQKWRPHSNTRVAATARLGAPESQDAADTEGSLTHPFVDNFTEESLSTHWQATGDNWKVEDGQLCGQRNRNHPVWLKHRLPRNARITFTARALSEFGDIKAEAWGDGKSYAKSNSYSDATSYLFILGGWKNQLHVLARFNEHDPNRLELATQRDATDPKRLPVIQNKKYQITIERSDGKTVTWRVNDQELFRFADPEPLFGDQHDRFGFNNWDTPVCFDDLTILPLPE
jgi:hypothetical protein